MNNLSYHLSNGTKQFADGATVHWRIEITRGIENNVDKWFIAYWINGRGYQYELFAGYGARHQLNYARGIDNAVVSAKMRIDRCIDKIHPPEVWVCPKPTPIPSAIVPYGMFAPVTYAPPPVISAPLADPRKLLAGETVELVRVVFAPMGYKDSWRAIGMFEGKEVHFRIYGEHAKLLKQAGHAPLAKGSMQIPHIDVVLEWSDRYNDLRMAGVFASDGTLHKLELPVAAPVPTEDNRTEIQKKLGIGNRYSGFDFRLNKTDKAS